MDIQVNMMQASNVAELAAQEKEEPKRARSERSRKWVEERRAEENTSDETGEQDENNPVDEDESGPFRHLETMTPGSGEDEAEGSSSQSSEPDKGTHLDLTT